MDILIAIDNEHMSVTMPAACECAMCSLLPIIQVYDIEIPRSQEAVASMLKYFYPRHFPDGEFTF